MIISASEDDFCGETWWEGGGIKDAWTAHLQKLLEKVQLHRGIYARDSNDVFEIRRERRAHKSALGGASPKKC